MSVDRYIKKIVIYRDIVTLPEDKEWFVEPKNLFTRIIFKLFNKYLEFNLIRK